MKPDPESGPEALLKRKSFKIFLQRKWRSLPRFLKLYLGLLCLSGLLLCVFLITSFDILGIVSKPGKPLVEVKPSQETPLPSLKAASPSVNYRQTQIVEAMKHSWSGYSKYAWGHDQLRPISKTYQEWFYLALTMIDSLDTLLLMGLEQEYWDSLDWIEKHLKLDIRRDVNCFETTIRILGGLLSAYHLNGNAVLLNKAADLGDRLIHCFDSPSKSVPYSDVNLQTKVPRAPTWAIESSLAEIASLQIEFRDLSRATGNPIFEKTSFKTSEHIHNYVSNTGEYLLPMYVNPSTGKFSRSTITLGARGDSYYEYLLKQYLQTKIPWLLDDYLKSVEAIRTELVRTTKGKLRLTYVGERLRSSKEIHPKMDHLVCFLPGTLALGYYRLYNKSSESNVLPDEVRSALKDHLVTAEDLARTCYHMYNLTATGLSPEIAYFSDSGEELMIRPADSHNLLRPEYVESLFYLYHITKKEMYREQGWKIFEAFNRYCRVASGGYTSINDVQSSTHPRPKDMQESFWMAETLKYLFLLFSDDEALVRRLLTDYVFNTEAHLLPTNSYVSSQFNLRRDKGVRRPPTRGRLQRRNQV